MIMQGDLKKIQESINEVLVPLGKRIDALEAEVKALKATKPPKSTKAAA